MNEFIAKIKDGAIESQRKYGVLASLTIAQAILESGWGKASIGNNIFGIKVGSNWKGKTQTRNTSEYVDGKYIDITAVFRDYDSIADSIADHALLFVNAGRYKNLIGCTDYKQACRMVQADGYATDPKYADKLISIIESNGLAQFDTVPAPAPAPVPVKPSAPAAGTYTVKSGDTLSGIAAAHKITLAAIIAANPQIKDPNRIWSGNVVNIPGGSAAPVPTPSSPVTQNYTVKSGDNMSKIAVAHGLRLSSLLAMNPQVKAPKYVIYAGQSIRVK